LDQPGRGTERSSLAPQFVDIEEKAIIIIAWRQPMAVDLREIVGALRISNDLERIGDLAQNIARRVALLTDKFGINEVALQLQRMAQLVLEQLARVIQSYEHRDADQAVEVWRKDQEIDALNNSVFRELLTYMMENPRNITFCTHMLFCAKNIERMGDHATNIAETVYYIVHGHPLSGERWIYCASVFNVCCNVPAHTCSGS
jgi:phosphate transport system protein